MKKTILLGCALGLLSSYPANAQVSVTFGEPVYAQPVYVAPPVYAPGYAEYHYRYPSQYYNRGYRHDDWAYWKEHDHGGHR